MRKRLLCVLLAAAMMTGCGGKSKEKENSYVAVYEEYTTVTEATVMETEPVETVTPITSENGYDYLSKVLFVGDGVCGKAVDCGLMTEDSIISVEGAMPKDILDCEINGRKISDIIKESGKPYIYLWFNEKDKLDKLSDQQYGNQILDLGTEIRELCPDSMVLPLSMLPLPEEDEKYSEVPEYNETLHMSIRSSPDQYLIYKDVFYVCAKNSGVLRAKFSAEDGYINSDAWTALFNFIERDRFYNDLIDDEDTYERLYAPERNYNVTDGKIAYLTFDDGPSKYTPQILKILRENDIKATFFITGWVIDGRDNTLRTVAEEGHTIALHSWSHDYDGIYESVDAWLADFSKVYNRVYAVTGQRAWAFRFPGGSYNNYNDETADAIIAEMGRRGFAYYDWSAATMDATRSATWDSCMENIEDSLGSDHEVILMHDSLEITPQYLQDVIDYIRSEGYTFETIDTADEVHF